MERVTGAVEYWAPPASPPPEPVPAGSRWRKDVPGSVGVAVVSLLLGAPAGLLWAAVTPHYVVHYNADGAQLTDLESTKAFIGADGSYLLVMLGAGIVCGLLAWRFARRFGPWTVVGLAVGGVLAALVAAAVGVQPGGQDGVKALKVQNRTSGTVELPLLKRFRHDELGLRAPWAAVGWPVGALTVFVLLAARKPEELG